MSDLELLANSVHHGTVQVRRIICDDFVRNPISTDYVGIDKFHYSSFWNSSVGCCLDPKGEIRKAEKSINK